jgi:heme/copper-type cytochrome/quinol oxidase subunit 2
MRHQIFALFFVAVLAFISTIVGVLAYLRLFNAEVIFWTNKPIESNEGKIAWILISIAVLIVSSIFAARAYRRQSRTEQLHAADSSPR